jgi:hypothetical protein
MTNEPTKQKKFELTKNTKSLHGRTLFQIRALISFADVCEGDLGGWVEKEENLSQEDNCWVYDDACVFENGRVTENGRVSGNSQVA